MVNTTRIAAFACANGLGHVRRVAAISTFILKNGFNGYIDLFIPYTHIKFLQNWPDMDYIINSPQVKIFDFEYPLSSQKVNQNFFGKDWLNINLPDLKKYDIVWSDNIVNILEKRRDTIFTGSFFWHEVFQDKLNENGLYNFVKEQRKIVKSVKPLMMGNEYFSTPDVRGITNFFPVGLYRYSLLFKEKNNKGILISCGLGGEEEEMARDAVSEIISKNIIPPEVLYVEARLLPKKYPEWIQLADFSDDMFIDCVAACIRPGIGTLSDALIGRNRVFAFCNENSFEMNHNCDVLKKMNLGSKYSSPLEAYLNAIKFINKDGAIDSQILRTTHLRTDGVFATANLLINQE